jgi:hypothetical protein
MRDLLKLIRWMLLGLVRSRRSIEAENLALRNQLNVLHRTAPKVSAGCAMPRRSAAFSEVQFLRQNGHVCVKRPRRNTANRCPIRISKVRVCTENLIPLRRANRVRLSG